MLLGDQKFGPLNHNEVVRIAHMKAEFLIDVFAKKNPDHLFKRDGKRVGVGGIIDGQKLNSKALCDSVSLRENKQKIYHKQNKDITLKLQLVSCYLMDKCPLLCIFSL